MHAWIPSFFTTQNSESVVELMYMFVTISAINTCSDLQDLDREGFIPFITGVETGRTTNRAIEVHLILMAG